MKLKRDIYSAFRQGFKYGDAGEEVKLVGTVIVENKYGVRFPVNAEDIIQDGEPTENAERITNKIPAKKQNKISQPTQTLF